jgi:hypothetical protein
MGRRGAIAAVKFSGIDAEQQARQSGWESLKPGDKAQGHIYGVGKRAVHDVQTSRLSTF